MSRSKIPRSPTLVARQRSHEHAAERLRVPRLLPEDIADDSRLGGVIDQVITGDDNYAMATAKVRDRQDRLQRLCDEDAWIAYLELEAALNVRVNMMLAAVVRWAFQEGRRSRSG